jgi:hypothetical protein
VIEGEGIASRVLRDLGVTEGRVQEAITLLSAAGGPDGTVQEAPPSLSGPRDPQGMARALDGLAAVERLAALQDRFGTTDPPPTALLELVSELRQVRERARAAISAQDYEAATRYRDEGARLHAEAVAQLDAWRRR